MVLDTNETTKQVQQASHAEGAINRSAAYMKSLYADLGHLNRLWKDHPHVHTDTSRHWQSIELRLSEYNEKELKDAVKIGVHWIILWVAIL